MSEDPQALLWGEDYVEYGEYGIEALSDDVALGISRGALPKPYWALDPNEDAVAAVIGEEATLLTCADGHNGFDSVRPAIETVLEAIGEPPPPPGIAANLIFGRANMVASQVTMGFADVRSQSRTTLAFALIAGSRVQWASMGDAPVYLAEPNATRVFIRDEHYFLPYAMDLRRIDERMHGGDEELAPGSWVVLASDGFSDYAGSGRGADAVSELAREAADADSLAEALINCAFDGGAGDNVAVAVARLR